MEDERRTRIFISHARADAAIARRLRTDLMRDGFEPYIDDEDIDVGAPWQDRLAELIARADVILFVISPKSIRSIHCEWELNEAERLGKRVLPAVWRQTDYHRIPHRLSRRNFAFLDKKSVWDTGYAKLVRAISENEAWTRDFSRLTELSERWARSGRAEHHLLRLGAVKEADEWAASRPSEIQDLPDGLLDFLKASRERDLADRDALRSMTARGFFNPIHEVAETGRLDAAARRLAAALVLSDDVDSVLVPELRQRYSDISPLRQLAMFDHGGFVRLAVASPDGRYLATISEQTPPVLWDENTARPIWTFMDHAHGCHHAAFSSDGKYLLTLARSCKVWNVASGDCVLTIGAHYDASRAVFSPDGGLIATSNYDGDVCIWSLTGQLCHRLHNRDGVINMIAFSADGKRLLSSCWDFVTDVWDVETGELLNSLLHGADALCAVFSPDGRYVVSGGQDGRGWLFDTTDGSEIAGLKGHDYPITIIAFDPSSRFILTGSNDGSARLWDMAGQALHTFQHDDEIVSAEFAPDGASILTADQDGTAKLWDGASGRLLTTLIGQGGLRSATFCGDGRRVLTAGVDGTARLWQTKPWPLIVDRPSSERETAALSPDGQILAVANDMGHIQLTTIGAVAKPWKLKLKAGRAISCLFLDDRTLQAMTREGRIELIDIGRADRRRVLDGEAAIADSGASADLSRLVSLHADATLRIWADGWPNLIFRLVGAKDLETAARQGGARSFGDQMKEILDGGFRGFASHETGLRRAAPDRTCTLVLVVCPPAPPRVWWSTGEVACTLETKGEELRAAEMLPDGAHVLLATRSRCWLADTDTGAPVRDLVGSGVVIDAVMDDAGRCAAVLLSETRSRLNRALTHPVHSLRSRVEVVDLATSERVSLEPSDHVGMMTFSPDGQVLITAGKHGEVEGWDATTGVRLFRLPDHGSEVLFVDLSKDNRRLLTVTADRVRVWDVGRMRAWQGRPVLGLAAALADGTGLVSKEERGEILMRHAPLDLHEALSGLLTDADRLEVQRRRAWLRSDRPIAATIEPLSDV